MTDTNSSATHAYPCSNCGAPLEYKPNTGTLTCPYCGTQNEIAQEDTIIEELDFESYIENFVKENSSTTKVITCSNCKATPTMDENLTSFICPYCSSPLIETSAHEERYIQPSYLMPFKVAKQDVNQILSKWVSGLYFAPNKLKRAAISPETFHGIYMPFWTYDAQADVSYTGQRGTYYTVTVGSGKNRRTETRVRWTFASGRFRQIFDDILISGSRILDPSLLQRVSGWSLKGIIRYNRSYLAGFITEKYQVDLKEGFIQAKQEMDARIRESVKRNIGGDQQRISSVNTQLSNVTFKHILLPIYISAFRYKDKLYSFYVNGQTGTISGKRPYSAIKIALAIIGGLILVAAFWYVIDLYYKK